MFRVRVYLNSQRNCHLLCVVVLCIPGEPGEGAWRKTHPDGHSPNLTRKCSPNCFVTSA